MAKFKVGDRVTLKEGIEADYWTHGKEYIVKRAYHECGYERISTNIDDKGNTTNGWLTDKFELFKPKSPVREVTKREIVEGSYGILSIKHSSCGEFRYFLEPYATPQQLREAAENLIKIAEVLEENGAND